MAQDVDSPQESRFAGAFIVIGLSLAAVGILYLVWMQRVQELGPMPLDGSDETVDEPSPFAKPFALFSALVITFVLFLAFLVGSYLMVRVGRMLVDRGTPPRETKYVDAWGSYRLTEAQIEDALREDPPPDPGGEPRPDPPGPAS
ncbi:MAG: hypothetical protein AMXMBFR47_30870 [Planctomycetota bacterium]